MFNLSKSMVKETRLLTQQNIVHVIMSDPPWVFSIRTENKIQDSKTWQGVLHPVYFEFTYSRVLYIYRRNRLIDLAHEWLHQKYASDYTEVLVRSHAGGILRQFSWPRIMHLRERNRKTKVSTFINFEVYRTCQKRRCGTFCMSLYPLHIFKGLIW